MLINENKSGYEVRLKPVPLNKTTAYYFPAIYLNLDRIKKLDSPYTDGFSIIKHYGFVNSYTSDINHWNSHPDCIYLLFNPTKDCMKKWWQMQELLESHKNHVETYDLDVNLISSVFRIAPKWQYLRKYLLSGSYSKFPTNYASEFFIANNGQRAYYLKPYKTITKLESYRKELEERTGEIIDPRWEYDSPFEIKNEIINWKPNS